MGTEAIGAAVQGWIDAREAADAIEYAIRSVKVSGNAYGASGIHAAQIVRGCQAATRVTGGFVAQDAGAMRALRSAKVEAVAQVKAADAAVKAFGSKRQIRMAMAA